MKKSLTLFKTPFLLNKTNLSSQQKDRPQHNKYQPLSMVYLPHLTISVQSLTRLNQVRLVLPQVSLQKHCLTRLYSQMERTYILTNGCQRCKVNSRLTRIITYQKEVNLSMQRIELGGKSYNILNLVSGSTLLLFSLLLTIYSTISKIYLATFIERSMLLINFES